MTEGERIKLIRKENQMTLEELTFTEQLSIQPKIVVKMVKEMLLNKCASPFAENFVLTLFGLLLAKVICSLTNLLS